MTSAGDLCQVDVEAERRTRGADDQCSSDRLRGGGERGHRTAAAAVGDQLHLDVRRAEDRLQQRELAPRVE